MTIVVKLFGPQSQMVGARELSLRTEQAAPTITDVRRLLTEAKPELAVSLSNSRLAVNFEFADENQTIRTGDEVALIGMVCGG